VSTPAIGPASLRVASRWARLLAGLWFAAAAVWLAGDLILLASVGRLGWDVLVVGVLVAVGVVVGRSSVEVDADGVTVRDGLRSSRILWASVERVEIDWTRRLDAPVRVHLRADDRPLALQATWRLPARDRERLLAALEPALAAHGVPLDRR
jgi:hypothetical protein